MLALAAGRQSGLNHWQDQSKELPGGGRIGLGGGGEILTTRIRKFKKMYCRLLSLCRFCCYSIAMCMPQDSVLGSFNYQAHLELHTSI